MLSSALGLTTGCGAQNPSGGGGEGAASAAGTQPGPGSASANGGAGVGGAGGSSGALAGAGGLGAEAGSGGAPATGGGSGSGGATSTGGAGGSTVTGTLELTIEPNPNSVLSAFVSWTTSEASTSVVEFGEGALTWEITGDAGVTTHRVLVIGMRADSLYQIRATSTGPSGTLQGDGTFMTGALPAQIPRGTISVHDAARTQPGWTLMNLQKGDGSNRALSGAPPAAVIYDEEGEPVWYYINRNATQNERGGAISVDMTDRGVLMGPTDVTAPIEVDWAGEELWTCNDVRCGGSYGLSHHAGKLSNGNYIIMRDSQASGGGRISQVFEEFTQAGTTPTRTIGVLDAIMPPASASGDWAHGNFISVDLANDVAYLSFRWLGLVKVTYSTKMMQWHLPASYGATGLGNMTFVPPSSQFTDIHAPDINADGTILFFDNGGFTGQVQEGNPGNLHTRVVEYRIDETARTATLVWEWPGTFTTDTWYKQELYVPFWGDADRLENGNVLITAGRRGVASSTPESRIIEVTKTTGEVVWELRFPKDHGVYRSERLNPLPLVRKIAP